MRCIVTGVGAVAVMGDEAVELVGRVGRFLRHARGCQPESARAARNPAVGLTSDM